MKLIINNDKEFEINGINEQYDNSFTTGIIDGNAMKDIKALVNDKITSLTVVRYPSNSEEAVNIDYSEYSEIEKFDRRITDDNDTVNIKFRKPIVEE